MRKMGNKMMMESNLTRKKEIEKKIPWNRVGFTLHGITPTPFIGGSTKIT